MGKRAIKKEGRVRKLVGELSSWTKEKLSVIFTRLKKTRPATKELHQGTKELKRRAATKPRSGSGRLKAKTEQSTGPRMAARRKHKLRWAQLAVAAVSCVFLLFVFVMLSSQLQAVSFFSFFGQKMATVKKETDKSEKDTLLLIGAKEKDGQESAAGLALIIMVEGEDKVAGWSIPENTFVVIPGRGFEKIGAVLESGTSTAVATVQNFLGVEVDHFARLDYEDYKETVSEMRLKRALEKADQTSLNRAEYEKFSIRFTEAGSQDINLIPLPVKPLLVGKETFLKPDNDEIDRLFALIWGIGEKERRGDVRIIVLNGSGVPGAGGDAAERLIDINCKVVETDNANNFDYDKTQIIIYKGSNKWANKIRDTLGAGVILRKHIPQDLADVTVVIGKDYQPKTDN